MGLPNLGGVFIVLTGGMIVSCFVAVMEFMWENRKMSAQGVSLRINNLTQDSSQNLSFILQQSVWAECWKEFKFAVDIRAGDTKPVPSESSSGSSSGSSDSHSESDHYGVINEDSKATGSLSRKKDDSGYAVFNEPNGKKHWIKFNNFCGYIMISIF